MSDTLFRVGTSGWRYPSWRNDFYPSGLVQRLELQHLASQLNSVEINGSFYSLQSPASYLRWAEQTPADFVFSVKGGRYITHMRKLHDVKTPLANFFASGVLALGPKLGPILWQFPEMVSYKPELFESFLELLPKTTAEAARLGAEHDGKLKAAWLEDDTVRPLQHAFEVRHPSFFDEGFYQLLHAHDVALVTADTAHTWPLFEEQTASFSYLRLHGGEQLYASNYDDAVLQRWVAKVKEWSSEGRQVYAYFDNDTNGYAPHNAVRLRQMLTG